VCSAVSGWSILYICYVQLVFSVVKSSVFSLIFCLIHSFTIENGVLKSLADIVLMSTSFLNSVNVCFIYLCAMPLSASVFVAEIPSFYP
jgi:hypothetical protein